MWLACVCGPACRATSRTMTFMIAAFSIIMWPIWQHSFFGPAYWRVFPVPPSPLHASRSQKKLRRSINKLIRLHQSNFKASPPVLGCPLHGNGTSPLLDFCFIVPACRVVGHRAAHLRASGKCSGSICCSLIGCCGRYLFQALAETTMDFPVRTESKVMSQRTLGFATKLLD